MKSFPIKRAILYAVVLAALNIVFLSASVAKGILMGIAFGLIMGVFDMMFAGKQQMNIERDVQKMEATKQAIRKRRR